ncbi:CehA/McbA family metallohydrolase [Lederbergia citri]|uniref:CehA/McbA family metallohydrolase n=1 Tax=Lederbergia citri TaxID=2833580 RepID=A0A942YII4_9BACI|nr:CehA/McbA family metallohydrolase [Lederbergia citri]MBS4196999.1 CehA/McbA family metallohydrolase [Lederbergia citri]
MLEIEVKQDKDSHQLNQLLCFNVPSHVHSVSIEVRNEQYMWLTYIVHDQQKKLRGQFIKVSTPQPIIIHQEQEKSSPYTYYGDIPEGEWTIDISIIAREEVKALNNWCTFTIMFNEASDNRKPDLYIWQDEQQSQNLLNVNDEIIFNESKRWYKGDFHTHTTFSDGKMTREENMDSAKNQNLDFFAATDHNIVPTSWFDETEILVIPGIEVSSPILGHFNVISTNDSPFSKHRLEDMFSVEGNVKLLSEDYGNALISISHPFLKHFNWKVTETPLDKIDSIEIWNDPTFKDNIEATKMALIAWNHLLNDGHKITGIGGSDSHNKPTEKYEGSTEPSLIGDPGTYVFCDQLTAANVVKGVKNGHVVVSRGEFIHFQIDDFISGDLCNVEKGTAKVFADTDDPIFFEWIVDGQVAKKETGYQSEFHFDFDKSYHWIRVDVRKKDGSLYGFTNPIYFGSKNPKLKKYGQLLEIMEK